MQKLMEQGYDEGGGILGARSILGCTNEMLSSNLGPFYTSRNLDDG